MKTAVSAIEHQAPRAFWLLSLSVAVLAGLYMFLVQSSVYYILSANEIGKVAVGEESSTARLEEEYYNLSSKITLGYAHSMGFVDTHESIYAKADSGLAQR